MTIYAHIFVMSLGFLLLFFFYIFKGSFCITLVGFGTFIAAVKKTEGYILYDIRFVTYFKCFLFWKLHYSKGLYSKGLFMLIMGKRLIEIFIRR